MNEDWLREFGSFLSESGELPPASVTEAIHARVLSDLHPSPWRVAWKVGAVHLTVGAVTLFFCPQFGFAPGRTEMMFQFLMRYGHAVCTAACGGFFLGVSALVVALVLRREEADVLRRHRIFPWVSLSIFSLLFFRLFGEIAFDVVLIAWIAGAVGGAIGSAELGWRVRRLATGH